MVRLACCSVTAFPSKSATKSSGRSVAAAPDGHLDEECANAGIAKVQANLE